MRRHSAAVGVGAGFARGATMRLIVPFLAALAMLGAGCSDRSTPSSDASTASDASGSPSTVPETEPSILAVQTAQLAMFDGSGQAYTLTMQGAADTTMWFTDRPDREAGAQPTGEMLENIFDPSNAAGPPNAAVVWTSDEGVSAVAVELTSGSYDEESETLTYELQLLERHDDALVGFGPSADVPTAPVGPVSVFVDSIFVMSVCELDVTNEAETYPPEFWWSQTIEHGYMTSGPVGPANLDQGDKVSWSWKQSSGENSCRAKVSIYTLGASAEDDPVITLDIYDPSVGDNKLSVSCADYKCPTKTLHDGTTYHMAVVICEAGVANVTCLARAGY